MLWNLMKLKAGVEFEIVRATWPWILVIVVIVIGAITVSAQED
jgi:hypothetical protein